ncbi:MAG: TIGR02444 family protein [Stellaceae bacterium]
MTPSSGADPDGSRWCVRREDWGYAWPVDKPQKPLEEKAFWRFSLAFYERPGVPDALIALQDRDGFDVNLILFALWLGMSGRGPLGGDALAAAQRVAGTLRSEIVEPLRRLRRNLRHHPDGDIQRLREGVKALEIASEKLVQDRLARLAGSGCAKTGPGDRRAAAHANLALYLGGEAVRCREAAVIEEALDAFTQDL